MHLFSFEARIMMMLLFTFIYDIIRRTYANTKLKRVALQLAAAADQFRPGSGGSVHSSDFKDYAHSIKTTSQTIEFKRIHRKSIRRLINFPTKRQAIDKLLFSEKVGGGLLSPKYSLSRSPDGHEIPEQLGQQHAQVAHDEKTQVADDCPLVEMPKYVRYYRNFSNIIIIIQFIKYTIICLLQFGWIGLDRYWNCYLPGRLSFLYDLIYELPGLSWIIIFYHIIYRYYLCFVAKEFDLECFLFVLYPYRCVREKEEISTKQTLNKKGTNTLQAHRYYLDNMLFFRQTQLINGNNIYTLRPHRGLKQWLRLRKFINILTIFGVAGLAFWSIPLGSVILYNLLSNDYFDANYWHCRSLSRSYKSANAWERNNSSIPFHWDMLSDPYRIMGFLVDGFDNAFLLFDTANALVWPFAAAVICVADVYFSTDVLFNQVVSLIKRLEHVEYHRLIQKKSWREGHNSSMRHTDSMKAIENDIVMVQADIIDVLNQLGEVDKFINKFAAFTVFGWAFVNLVYQLVCILKSRLLVPNQVIIYMQVVAYVIITMTFWIMGTTHTKTAQLYHRICSLVALDPNYKTTKSNWMQVFEFFYQETSRYSFHIGPTVELSLANFLKFTMWFFSCTLIMLNLLRNNLDALPAI